MGLASQALPGPMPTTERRASSLAQTRPRGGAKGRAVSRQNSDRSSSPLSSSHRTPLAPQDTHCPHFTWSGDCGPLFPRRVAVSQDIALASNREGSRPSLGDSSLLTSLPFLVQFVCLFALGLAVCGIFPDQGLNLYLLHCEHSLNQ